MTIVFDEDKQNKDLGEFRKREEEELAQILAQRYEIEYADLAPVPINMDALRIIPEEMAREAKAAAFNMVGKRVKIGVLSPANEKTEALMKYLLDKNFEVTPVVVSNASLQKAWERYKDLSYATETKAGALEVSSEDIKEYTSKIKNVEDVKTIMNEIVGLKKAYRISKILEVILGGALATKASDVHIEPEEEYVRLRFRLDGVLVNILNFDRETYMLFLSRIKLLSGLKLNIKSEAQDGRFSVKIGEDDIEIRTSILPGAYSESIVMRILNPKSIQVPLEDLGIPKKLLEVLLKEIDKPNGMILTTGPTGSGKTTTLYAFLRKIHTPEIKIITIEDPIEYHLPGIVQTQTNAEKGYTFLSGLRSALRQDPDVIMVGEIRDAETASIAINSAQTGHLVFSTLHTNNAAGTFPRLIDLGVNPKTITSAINISLAQRLLRKLCDTCKKKEVLAGDSRAFIDETLSHVKDADSLVGVQKEFMWVAVGCEKCNNSGYKGRIGIYEAILTDEKVEAVIRTNPSEREIQASAVDQGILTMKQDGALKILGGVTSLDELRRVIDTEDSIL